MRDTLKTKEHFEEYIKLNAEDIEYFEEGIETGRTNPEQIPSVKRQICSISIHNIIAKYSAGYDNSELKDDFETIVVRFEKGWISIDGLDDYNISIWFLSLGVLLDVELSVFERMVNVIDKTERKDFLLDFIISSKIPKRQISEDLFLPKFFTFLKEFIETQNIENLQKYLDKKWYKSMKMTYWYDNHKSKHDTYFVYWSFESGAIVKILGLDDSILKNQQYYPYDLVHWKK